MRADCRTDRGDPNGVLGVARREEGEHVVDVGGAPVGDAEVLDLGHGEELVAEPLEGLAARAGFAGLGHLSVVPL